MSDIMEETDFFAAHAEFVRTRDELHASFLGLNDQYKAELAERYKEQYPRRVFNYDKASREPWFNEVYQKWLGISQEKSREFNAFKESAEERLRSLAQDAVVPATEDMILISQKSGYMYNSQGYGANKYARGSALFDADKAEHYGLRTEVRTVDKAKADQWGIAIETYGVYANTTEEGMALLHFKEAPPLREQVRLSWKRGTNPRVYMPFLPHGYEEQEGLDFYGNDLRAEQGQSPSL